MRRKLALFQVKLIGN